MLGLARFPYFKWAAADDLCGPTFLSRCLEQMIDGGEGTVIAYPETTLIDVDGARMVPSTTATSPSRTTIPFVDWISCSGTGSSGTPCSE